MAVPVPEPVAKGTALPEVSGSASFAKGQLWKIDESFMRIGHVGRLLVHHRTEDPVRKRASRESLTSIKDLQEFFRTKNAVLLPQP